MIRVLLSVLALSAVLVTQASAQAPQPRVPCEQVLGSITTNLVNEQNASAAKDQDIRGLREQLAKLQAEKKPAEAKPPEAPK